MILIEKAAERLADLSQRYPDGVPAELVDAEARRIREALHMIAEGLAE